MPDHGPVDHRQVSARFVDLLLAGDWAVLQAHSTPAMATLLRKDLPKVWKNATGRAGAFQQIDAQLVSVPGDRVLQSDHTLKFERAAIRVRIALADDGQLAGLVIRPADWS